MAGGLSATCDRMPLPLTVCHVCHAGIKPTRGWQWVVLPTMVQDAEPRTCDSPLCHACPMNPQRPEERMGLLWCGEKFYPTPHDWIREAQTQGISRRLPAVPKDLVLGHTWVVMVHRKAVQGLTETGDIVYHPGLIQAFRPTALEYVVRGDEIRARSRCLDPFSRT